jgi:hypothetical protein
MICPQALDIDSLLSRIVAMVPSLDAIVHLSGR